MASSGGSIREGGLIRNLLMVVSGAVLIGGGVIACNSGSNQERSGTNEGKKTEGQNISPAAAKRAPADQVGSASQPGPIAQPSSGGDARPLKLAFVTNASADFWTIARAGVNTAAGELKSVTIEFKIPPDSAAGTQKQIIDDLLVKKFDGIAVSPIDPINMSPYLAEVSKQTLLLTQDSDALPNVRACYVGSDNVAAGRMAGEAIKEVLPEGGEVMLFVGLKDAQNARERIQGIEEVLKGTEIKILDIRSDDTDRARARANVSDALVKYPQLKGLVGLWAYNGPAILNAVRDANNEAVKIITFDEEDETLAGVESGRISATIVQQPYQFGYQAIHLMAKVLREGKQALPASGRQIIPTRKITKETVGAFKEDLARLRRGGK
jgi:ribose transport system substrate-binding protein